LTIPAFIQNALPPLPVAMPLLLAALLAAFRQHLSRTVADVAALIGAGCNVAACALLFSQAQTQTIVYWFGGWQPRGSMALGISFVIDPAAAALALVCGGLTFLAILFSWRHTDAGANHFQPLMLVFLAGLSGFTLTGDLFNLFVFFELMSTAAFALTGLKTQEPAPLQGAFNFAVTNTVAGFMVLTGIAFLYAITGALNIAQIGLLLPHRHDPLVLFAFALITCGFFTKGAIAPFHFWLPDAHAVSPTPVCVLFSGVMVELALYAIARLYAVVFLPALDARAAMLRSVLLGFGGLTVLVGGFMCYAEHHLKRLLAFSTVSHAGLMLLGVAIQGTLATAGFLVYFAGHALVKSSLFFVAGMLLHRYRTMSEPALHGRARDQMGAAALWFMGGLGLAGFPCFGTSLGDALTSNAADAKGINWVSYAFLVSGALTAGAVFRVGLHAFLGWGEEPISDRSAQVDEKPETRQKQRRPWYLAAPPIACLGAAIALMFAPHVRQEALMAANRMESHAAYLHAVYKGTLLPLKVPEGMDLSTRTAGIHGAVASLMGLVLALTSVFRTRLRRWFRAGAFLEGRLGGLRALQSGHVGDYVLWMTIGTVVLGGAYLVLLR
jgi:multicomponent Na+:H+ antiporter subunit D